MADYTKTGVARKAWAKDEQHNFSLFCLTAGTSIPEHTAPRPISLHLSTSALGRAIASEWNPVCHITYNRDAWDQLLQPPSAYGFDEAKLLCQESLYTWVAWVPEQSEVMLDKSHFYCKYRPRKPYQEL